ncbi:hypothetical protein FACS18949_11820 [Clostridia bacterium]|nr:hypothetical protein FACS18949_11820 [Clostridia bacterium]
MYYRKCNICGANLDPGERCDCDRYDCKSDSVAAIDFNERNRYIRKEGVLVCAHMVRA